MSVDHLLRVIRLKLVEVSTIQQAVKQVPRIVWLLVSLGNDVVKSRSWSSGLHTWKYRNCTSRFYRQLGDKLANFRQAGFVVRNTIMGHARKLVMCAGSPQSFVIDCL